MHCHDNNNNDNNNNHIQRCCSRSFLQSHSGVNCLQHAQVAQAQSCVNHVQHIERLPRATCRVTCHLVQRDSSVIKFDRVEIALI